MRAIDCQGFAGAFALGVVQAGFDLVGKRENVGGFGIPLVEGNRHLLPGDWTAEACEPAEWSVPKGGADLVFGNPPCSGFSGLSVCIAPKAGNVDGRRSTGEAGRIDWRGIDSSANTCMWDLIDFAARCKPTTVIFESVQPAGRVGRPLMQALRARLEAATKRRFGLWHVFHNNLSVGGFAMRKRYFFVASRLPFGVDHVELDRPLTLRDAIGDLQRLRLGTTKVEGHVTLNSQRARRMAWLASNAEWHEGEHSGTALARVRGKLSDDWFTRVGTQVRTDSGTSLYAPRRWKYDEPARVITGLGLEENVHPVLPRTFTHREAARIMGYPDEWLCWPAIERGNLGAKWWGKQIPVASGRWIATAAEAALSGAPGADAGELVGEREWVIDVTHDWKMSKLAMGKV